MENQHRLIKDYRELSAEEIALINDIKAHGAAGEALGARVKAHVSNQIAVAMPKEGDTPEQSDAKQRDLDRIQAAEPLRWLAIARTDRQTAGMALTRAVAQPEGF